MRAGSVLSLASIVVLVVVVAVGVIAHAWYEQQPPALSSSGPGTVLRLTTESGGIPPPRVRVDAAGGTAAFVFTTGIDTSRGRPLGMVVVQPPNEPAHRLSLAEGQSGAAGGIRVTVLHLWRMPDIANDAVDVRVLPSP